MSNSPKVERKTKAIMFTDIAGYTKAMSESEQKALEMLRKKRTIIKTLIVIIKTLSAIGSKAFPKFDLKFFFLAR